MLSRQTCMQVVVNECTGEKQYLAGWVENLRYLGQLIFISLRDRSGHLQVVVEASKLVSGAKFLDELTVGSALEVAGSLAQRPIDQRKSDVFGGEWEFQVTEILNVHACAPLPIQTNQPGAQPLDRLLRYRYLALRSPVLSQNLRKRAAFIRALRSGLEMADFCEVETPILSNATPEGARDYLVPSRIHPGQAYALPQSPQLYKQLLMIGGIERYYQIARCFRDEDLRSDRQPEFTQLDIETAFLPTEAFLNFVENLVREAFSAAFEAVLPAFPTLTYHEAIAQYGTDKPDLRFGNGLVRLDEYVKSCPLELFQDPKRLENWGILGLPLKSSEKPSRSTFQEAQASAIRQGLHLMRLEVVQDEPLGLRRFKSFSAEHWAHTEQDQLCERLALAAGEGLIVAIGHAVTASEFLGKLRVAWRSISPVDWAPLWVTAFPVFERSTSGQLQAMHHPFSAPLAHTDLETLPPDAWLSDGYDMVLNGYELGSGSRRIHDPVLQKRIFSLLGLSEATQERQFGFFTDALGYGAPPHAGIALGIDRMVMLGTGAANLREVIAFPKTTSASCPMMGSPSTMEHEALESLGLRRTGRSL